MTITVCAHEVSHPVCQTITGRIDRTTPVVAELVTTQVTVSQCECCEEFVARATLINRRGRPVYTTGPVLLRKAGAS